VITPPPGWYRDPSGRHQDRYFSEGEPTQLVRDASGESFDRIATDSVRADSLVPVAPGEVGLRGGADMRRADDMRPDGVGDLRRKALDVMARCRGGD